MPTGSSPRLTETTGAATGGSSAPGTAIAPAGWPEEAADIRSGGTFWAVFLAMVPGTRSDSLQPVYKDAVSLNYNAAIGDVCASGADGHALPFDWSSAPMAVSIDFDTEAAVSQFVTMWKAQYRRDVTGVYNVRLACAD